MVHSAVVFAEAGRPIRSREGTAMDELAGVPALTLSQLPRNAHLLDLATFFELTNPLHRAALLGAFHLDLPLPLPEPLPVVVMEVRWSLPPGPCGRRGRAEETLARG